MAIKKKTTLPLSLTPSHYLWNANCWGSVHFRDKTILMVCYGYNPEYFCRWRLWRLLIFSLHFAFNKLWMSRQYIVGPNIDLFWLIWDQCPISLSDCDSTNSKQTELWNKGSLFGSWFSYSRLCSTWISVWFHSLLHVCRLLLRVSDTPGVNSKRKGTKTMFHSFHSWPLCYELYIFHLK